MTCVAPGESEESLALPPEVLANHSLCSEYSRVCRNVIDGLYVIPSGNDAFKWFGIIFIRRGVYGGGIFRFMVDIQQNFPNTHAMPCVTFESRIFHPHINSKTNQLDVSRYFPDGWKREKHHIQNILLVVQRVFFSIDADSSTCVNPEAAILWKEHKDKYRELAKDCVNSSRAEVYNEPSGDDPHVIRLTPWDASIHESARQRMFSTSGRENTWSSDRGGTSVGLSWVDPESMTYMTDSMKYDTEADVRAKQDRLVFGIERLDLSSVHSDESPEISAVDTDQHSLNNATAASHLHPKLYRTTKDSSTGNIEVSGK